MNLHQEGSPLGGYPRLCWKNLIAEVACSRWITGITVEVSDLVRVCKSDSLGAASFAVVSSASPIYSSAEGTDSTCHLHT